MDSDELLPWRGAPTAEWSSENYRTLFADQLREATRSTHTARAYDSDFRHFQSWCEHRGVTPLPATEPTLIAYLLYFGDPDGARLPADSMLKQSTLARRIAGIRDAHRRAGERWQGGGVAGQDLVTATLTYVAVKQKRGVDSPTALSRARLLALLEAIPNTPHGIRNRAMLQVGYYGALRASEIVGLDLDDITFSEGSFLHRDEGMTIQIRASKTDRKGRGQQVCVNYSGDRSSCPVRALQSWIRTRGSVDGPLFTNLWGNGVGSSSRLTTQTVTAIVKQSLAEIGTDPGRYSAHSLRSGFATAAAALDVPARLIKQQTRHSSYEMVDRYIQSGSSLAQNATRYMV